MGGKTKKEPVPQRWEVYHPLYGTIQVVALTSELATKVAFEDWGVPEQWKYLAGGCMIKWQGSAQKPRCRRCAREYGEPGDTKGLCPECQRITEKYRRELAQVRPRDRRAGMRGER